MKVLLLVIGKTDQKFIQQAIDEYLKRLKRYTSFEMKVLADIKNAKSMPESVQKQKEGELILKHAKDALLVLLDENGKEYGSSQFAKQIEQWNHTASKTICFVIGGPYGFSDEVYARSNQKISLSKMTFSHQMVRMIFLEQLYRAHTIIKGEPYHHQ